MPKAKNRKYNIIAYAGFCNDHIHKTKEADSEYRILAIFPNKRTAKLAYEDVRTVVIEYIV